MKRVRQEGTAPELRVRKALTSIGARYRVNVRGLPGRPDIANRKRRKAIFVHGCFWHFHSECGRGQIPTRNRDFWEGKLRANRARDDAKREALKSSGFKVLIVWECELEEAELIARLRDF